MKPKGDDPACVAGILVEGQAGSSIAWKAGVERHEILLPITAILEQLDHMFIDEDGVPFSTGTKWYQNYKVTIKSKTPARLWVNRR
jgi:hypothetical protein